MARSKWLRFLRDLPAGDLEEFVAAHGYFPPEDALTVYRERVAEGAGLDRKMKGQRLCIEGSCGDTHVINVGVNSPWIGRLNVIVRIFP